MADVKRAKVTLDDEKLVVVIEDGGKSKTYRLDKVPEGLHARFALHGMAQKLRDAVASKSAKAGYSAGERFEVMDKLFEAFCKGEYTVRGEGGGGGGSQLDEAARKFLAGELSDAEQKVLDSVGLLEKIKARARKLQEKEQEAALEDGEEEEEEENN
jgi:hypothetical protein